MGNFSSLMSELQHFENEMHHKEKYPTPFRLYEKKHSHEREPIQLHFGPDLRIALGFDDYMALV